MYWYQETPNELTCSSCAGKIPAKLIDRTHAMVPRKCPYCLEKITPTVVQVPKGMYIKKDRY